MTAAAPRCQIHPGQPAGRCTVCHVKATPSPGVRDLAAALQSRPRDDEPEQETRPLCACTHAYADHPETAPGVPGPCRCGCRGYEPGQQIVDLRALARDAMTRTNP